MLIEKEEFVTQTNIFYGISLLYVHLKKHRTSEKTGEDGPKSLPPGTSCHMSPHIIFLCPGLEWNLQPFGGWDDAPTS